MKYLIAMDSYKGNLTADEVCMLARDGILDRDPEAGFHLLPLADGGEGTAAAISAAMGGRMVEEAVTGPFGESALGYYAEVVGHDGDKLTVIDTAAASGIVAAKAHGLDPLHASTYGTGVQIRDALLRGSKRVIVGLGGSGTNDGGIGAAYALGMRFYDKNGVEVNAREGGIALSRIHTVDKSGLIPELRNAELRLMFDVAIPLYGERGATLNYSRQKGSTPESMAVLEAGMVKYAEAIGRSLGIDINEVAGAGAAGGLGCGLMLAGGVLTEGAPYMLEVTGFDALCEDSDIVITGEGKTDYQSEAGKLPVAVARRAKKFSLPVVCICGTYEPSRGLYGQGIDAVFSTVNRPMPLEEAIAEGGAQLRQTCFDIAGLVKCLTAR